jgi:hypothetical protein
MTRVRIDDLLGAKVRDANGRVVGRIFEIQAEKEGSDLVLVAYYLGPAALLDRMGVSVLTLVGLAARRAPRKVPWDQLDISDVSAPKLVATDTAL